MTRTTHSALSHPRRLALGTALATAFALGAAVLAPSAALADRAPNKIRIVPDLNVEIWTNKGPNAKYCVGESIEIYFRTNVDAYVAVFDTDTRGDTHRLFPNRYDREHFVRGGVTYRLPADGYNFKIEGPSGYETLKVVAAENRRELRRAVDTLIHDRRTRPARFGGSVRIDKIAVVPDGVAFDTISHRVRDGRRCHSHYDRPRGVRPWWR